MTGEQRWVVQDGDDWVVRKPGSDRASSRHDTQKEADKRAAQILANVGGESSDMFGWSLGAGDFNKVNGTLYVTSFDTNLSCVPRRGVASEPTIYPESRCRKVSLA